MWRDTPSHKQKRWKKIICGVLNRALCEMVLSNLYKKRLYMQYCQWLATTIEFNNPTEKIWIYPLCIPFGVSCHEWCGNHNTRLFCALVTRLRLQWLLRWSQAKCAPRVNLSLIPIHKGKLSYLILRMLVNGLNLLNATKLDQANYFARNTGTSGVGSHWKHLLWLQVTITWMILKVTKTTVSQHWKDKVCDLLVWWRIIKPWQSVLCRSDNCVSFWEYDDE